MLLFFIFVSIILILEVPELLFWIPFCFVLFGIYAYIGDFIEGRKKGWYELKGKKRPKWYEIWKHPY